MQPQFWAGRRVLLTGHTGFKGAWLSLWLQELGSEVAGLSRSAPAPGGFFDAAGVGEGMTSVRGDLLDPGAVARAVADHEPEVVVHLAGQPLVRTALADPAGTFAANVLGVTHLLDAIRATPSVRAVLCVTTDKVYAPPTSVWPHRETDPLGGHDPYTASKACAELVVDAYRRSFFAAGGPHVATARTSNLVGGGDRGHGRLVPDLLRAVVAGEPMRLRNPAAQRPWLHVLDALHGYLLLLERLWDDPGAARAWNFGPDDVHSVGWVAGRIAELWGDGAGWTAQGTPDPVEAPHVRLDTALARTHLAWRPRWDLDTALESVVEHARVEVAGGGVRDAALDQLAAFSPRVGDAAAR
jgi:CDP-glucose 4,6-dehydratase